MGLDFSVVPDYMDTILLGILWTLAITLVAAVISVFGGVFFALTELYAHWFFKYPIKAFAFIFMGTPLLLQLFFLYFGLGLIGIPLSPFVAGIIGLGLFYSVYNSELIQTAMITVDNGQTEGARSLGLSKIQTIHNVILPQAVRKVIPPMGNNLIMLMKDSALVSAIGVTELIHASELAIGETFRPFEFYIAAGVCYYIINLFMEAGLRKVERKVQVTK